MTHPHHPPASPRTTQPTRHPVCTECLRPATADWSRSWTEVDTGALRRNVSRLAASLGGGSRLIVSAKKDGYGHGLIAVARALAADPHVSMLGLVNLEEVLALRAAGFEADLICFTVFAGEALDEAIRHGAIVTVTTLDEARAADHAAERIGTTARAHFKMDTGMARLGQDAERAAAELPELRRLPHLRIEGVYTHFADAWAQPESAREQVRRFEGFRAAAGAGDLPCHWGGSDALALPELFAGGADLRSGIALYGEHPAVDGLEPVMTFKSRVIYRRRVPAGTTVSYGLTFTTRRETELAVVGAGYGNGLMRGLSRRGNVLIGEARCPILGTVCMDQIVVDVTARPATAVGDEAVIFGRQGAAELRATEQADHVGTIPYELTCLAGQLNPRIVR